MSPSMLEAGLEGLEFAWKHRRTLGRVSAELLTMIRAGRMRVLVFGSAGAGKSTVAKLLTGTLSRDDLLAGYRDSFAIERHDLPGTVFGRLLVAPGQRTRQHAQDELLAMLPEGKVHGIINVAAYGYHAFPRDASYRDDGAFVAGRDVNAFMHAYLERRQAEELRALETLAPYMMRAPQPIWFMTFVTKQDLWWDRKEVVRAHYELGPYAAVLARIQASMLPGRFRHDTAYGAVTWENFRDGQHELLASTAGGYDQVIRTGNLARFGDGLGQFLGIAR